MLRSLIAVIAAAIAGLAAAKFIESSGVSLLSADAAAIEGGSKLSGPYQTVLALSWFFSAFISAALALLIGKRWAPLGAWAAATMLFSAIITQITFSMSWFMWPVSVLVAGLGGFAAIRLLKARIAYPGRKAGNGLF